MKINWTNTEEALKEFGDKVVATSRKNLNDKGPLSDSIRYIYKESEKSYEFRILMLDYGNFQDKGVKGHGKGNWKPNKRKRQGGHGSPFKYKTGPGKDTILKSMVNQPSFRTRDSESGKFTPKTEANKNQAAFLIARSIGRFGIPAKRFMSKAIAQHGKKLTESLGSAWVADQKPFINNIKNQFKYNE